jgi:hypothetical protein
MMSTVLLKDGFRFAFFTNDHTPPHVHVFKAGGELVVFIGTPLQIVQVYKMKKTDVRRAMKILLDNQEFFVLKWKEIHGKS